MEISDTQLERIERYLSGEMGAEEYRQFETTMQEDSRLREKVELMRDIQRVAGRDGRAKLRDKLKAAEQKYAAGIESAPNRKKIRFYRSISAAATILILVSLSVYLYISNNAKTRLYDQYLIPPENTYVDYTRGDFDSKSTQMLIRAAKYYDRENYAKAADLFEKHLGLNAGNKPYIFLAAVSNIEVGHYQLAAQQLNYLKQTDASGLPVDYFLAISYLFQEDKAQAMKHLKEAAQENDYYAAKASELIGKL